MKSVISSQTKTKRKRIHIAIIRNERKDISTYPMEIPRIIKEF